MGALKQYQRDLGKLAVQALSAGNHLLLFESLSFQHIDYINAALSKEIDANNDLNDWQRRLFLNLTNTYPPFYDNVG